MMHSNNCVVAIKVNGKVLREQGDTVTLPFGCEYSILLKNIDSVRAQVSVSVDGKDATDGTRLIIAPNSSIELERFIRNGNLSAGNRFKFIERSPDVEAHRGIGADDGLVRVEYWKERVQKFVDVPTPRYYDEWYPVPRPYYPPYPTRPYRGPGPLRGAGRPMMRGFSAPLGGGASASLGKISTMTAMSDAGITVAGSESRQQFHSTHGFPLLPQSTVITLRLRGEIGGEPVVAPITVEHKPTCSTCGKTSTAGSQFCAICGTALLLF